MHCALPVNPYTVQLYATCMYYGSAGWLKVAPQRSLVRTGGRRPPALPPPPRSPLLAVVVPPAVRPLPPIMGGADAWVRLRAWVGARVPWHGARVA
eukprot:COSAG01_NODE_3487_length_6017_cov_6.010814_7_plen_95_part_01